MGWPGGQGSERLNVIRKDVTLRARRRELLLRENRLAALGMTGIGSAKRDMVFKPSNVSLLGRRGYGLFRAAEVHAVTKMAEVAVPAAVEAYEVNPLK